MIPNNLRKVVEAVKDQSRVSGCTHQFYTYPAGFSPVFAGAAIESLTKKGDLVLDPFMGGGTTVVEAIRHGREVVGVDLNPNIMNKYKYYNTKNYYYIYHEDKLVVFF